MTVLHGRERNRIDLHRMRKEVRGELIIPLVEAVHMPEPAMVGSPRIQMLCRNFAACSASESWMRDSNAATILPATVDRICMIS